MKNERFLILKKYVEKMLVQDNKCKAYFEKLLKPVDMLLLNEKISSEENDLIVDSFGVFEILLLELIASCPFVKIDLNNETDVVDVNC